MAKRGVRMGDPFAVIGGAGGGDIGMGNTPGAGGGGSSFSPELLAAAARIIAAAEGWSPRGVVAVAPTLTAGAAGANSLVNGATLNAPTHDINDNAKFSRTGPLKVHGSGSAFGYLPAWSTKDDIGTLLDGGQGYTVDRFNTTGLTSFDMMVPGVVGNNRRFQFRFAGEWAASSDYSLTVTSGTRAYVRIVLNRTFSGLVEIFCNQNQGIGGININAGATITAPTAPPVLAEIWGDSYTRGNTGWGLRTTPAQVFGEKMGILDIVPQGGSGEGYVKVANSNTIGGRIVLDAGRAVASPDLVVTYGSVNDHSEDMATVGANYAAGLQHLQGEYPDAWILAFVSFNAVGAEVDAAEQAVIKAAIDAVADERTLVIDTSSWPQVAGAGAGNLPNGQPHDSPDNVHPGPNEVAYLTDLMKTAALAAIKSATGL